jgi:hypothetical protein
MQRAKTMNAKTKCWSALLALLITTASPTAAAAIASVEPIPTMLVATDEPSRYPDPICSKCKIIVVEDESSAGTTADVRITYPGDAPRFVGELDVTVLLRNGERRTLWLSPISLAPNSEVELVAEADSDWSWNQVRFVWLRFVPE